MKLTPKAGKACVPLSRNASLGLSLSVAIRRSLHHTLAIPTFPHAFGQSWLRNCDVFCCCCCCYEYLASQPKLFHLRPPALSRTLSFSLCTFCMHVYGMRVGVVDSINSFTAHRQNFVFFCCFSLYFGPRLFQFCCWRTQQTKREEEQQQQQQQQPVLFVFLLWPLQG